MSSLLLSLLLLLGPATTVGAAAGVDGDDPVPTIARLQYSGGDWYVGPSSLPNLLREIRARTGLPVAERPVTVRLTDPDLWRYPYLFMTGHGNVEFSEEEAQNLRRYLLSGGFLHADDCYGMDEHFRRAIRQVFPDKELVEIPSDHPIYHTFYSLPDGLPKVHQHDGKPPAIASVQSCGQPAAPIRKTLGTFPTTLRFRHPWLSYLAAVFTTAA
jgi:hypothetical protein